MSAIAKPTFHNPAKSPHTTRPQLIRYPNSLAITHNAGSNPSNTCTAVCNATTQNNANPARNPTYNMTNRKTTIKSSNRGTTSYRRAACKIDVKITDAP